MTNNKYFQKERMMDKTSNVINYGKFFAASAHDPWWIYL